MTKGMIMRRTAAGIITTAALTLAPGDSGDVVSDLKNNDASPWAS